MPLRFLIACLAATLVTGCASMQSAEAPDGIQPGEEQASAATPGSLFPGDQVVLSDQQIERIFQTRIETPNDAKLAVIRYGSWPAWYWSEDFARLDQQSLQAFMDKLKSVPALRTVQIIPEMLVPRQMDIPHLRETAARVQADLLLIYRPTNHSYQKSRFLRKDQTKAYCTVEVALLDTRSGVITYTTRQTEDYMAEQTSKDMSFEETMARAEQEAIGRAMSRVAADVASYLEVPKAGSKG
jgi:hypothetical protein